MSLLGVEGSHNPTGQVDVRIGEVLNGGRKGQEPFRQYTHNLYPRPEDEPLHPRP